MLGTVAAVVCVFALATTGSMKANGKFGSDAWSTTRTKIALITNEDVSAMDVNVDTVDGMVTLHGKVPNDLAKEKATMIAKEIDGVRDVRNLLQVVEEASRDASETNDEMIAENVAKAIENGASLKDSEIDVQSVNEGVVLLSGRVSSLGDHLEALHLAGDVPGARRVASQITSDDRLYDTGIWEEGAIELLAGNSPHTVRDAREDTDAAGDVGTTVKYLANHLGARIADVASASGRAARATGRTFRDAWIPSAMKANLVANDSVSAKDINVDARNGVVSLSDTVDSMEAKAVAEQDARSVGGACDVENEIEITMIEKRAVD
jgi:hyperosmotically inducible protein